MFEVVEEFASLTGVVVTEDVAFGQAGIPAATEAASGELDDTTRADGEGPQTPADGGELATNSDTSSANLGARLELDAARNDAFLESSGQRPLES